MPMTRVGPISVKKSWDERIMSSSPSIELNVSNFAFIIFYTYVYRVAVFVYDFLRRVRGTENIFRFLDAGGRILFV